MEESFTCLCPKEDILIWSISCLDTQREVHFSELAPSKNLFLRNHKAPGQRVIGLHINVIFRIYSISWVWVLRAGVGF